MRAVEIADGELRLASRPTPRPGKGEVLVKVAAAGVNRPDVIQRKGLYPPPPGASDIPGLEISGTVVAAGQGSTHLIGSKSAPWSPAGAMATIAWAGRDCLPSPRCCAAEAAAMRRRCHGLGHLFERGFAAEGIRPGPCGTSGIGTMAIRLARYSAGGLVTCGRTRNALRRSNGRWPCDQYSTTLRRAVQRGRGKASRRLDMVGGDMCQGISPAWPTMAATCRSLSVAGQPPSAVAISCAGA